MRTREEGRGGHDASLLCMLRRQQTALAQLVLLPLCRAPAFPVGERLACLGLLGRTASTVTCTVTCTVTNEEQGRVNTETWHGVR